MRAHGGGGASSESANEKVSSFVRPPFPEHTSPVLLIPNHLLMLSQ